MRKSHSRAEPKYLHLLVMLFAAVGFVYLLLLSRSDDPGRHLAVLDHIRELARLDAIIDHAVLRMAYGDKDAASEAGAKLAAFDAVLENLQRGSIGLEGRFGSEVDGSLLAYRLFHWRRLSSVDEAGDKHDLAGDELIATATDLNRSLLRAYERAYDPIREQAKFYRMMMGIEALLGLGYVGYFALRLHRAKEWLRDSNRALVASSEELAEAKREAERADMAKSLFLANMSHELRTPMNGIVGMAELLAASAADERQRSQADVIVRSAGALLTIINDILDFAKIEAGEVTFELRPFSLRDAIGDVTELFKIACQRKGLSLSVRIAPGLSDRYVGDRGRFCQVVTNLVGNSVKFTDRGRVLIDIRDAASTGGSGLLVMVADSGIGIPESKREAVFEKFRQVDNTTKANRQGTGLGLAISRMLVEQMGGRIGVESRLGEGSTFWLSLPLARDDAVQVPASSQDGGALDRLAA